MGDARFSRAALRRTLGVGSLLTVMAAGCAEMKPTGLNYHVLRLSGAPEAAVFDAAERALGEHFTIRRRDRAAGVLEGAPLEGVGAGGGGRLGDYVAMPRRERRIAEMRVEESGKVVKVFCKVLVQEYDTQAHEMFGKERSLHDLPTDTPAYREAATTTEQNAVWRTKHRDRGLETAILEALRERVPGAQVL